LTTTPERLATIETDLKYVRQGIDRLEKTIHENTQPVEALKKELTEFKTFCSAVQLKKRYGLSGKDKAAVSLALITALVSIALALIEVL